VPRIYERIYARLQDSLAEKSVVTRAVFALAVRTGWRHFEYRQQRAGWRPSLLLWPWLEKKVAHPLQARLGGRLRYAVSGGAAITREIAETFVGLGIPLYQGYGLTETSPVISVNRVESNIPTSIGLPLDGVAVRLAPDGELLTRSACVMRGYWQDEAATRAMIDADGWLHTGDLARQDARGHYHIIGRSKDIIVLSNGEKVPPVDMEAAITLDPLFAQALVIGEGRPYLVALVVVDSEHWAAFATHHGLPADPARFADPKVMKALLTQLGRQLKAFPGYAQIRRILPLTDPWTVENDLLTPTLKTKRATLLSHYAKAIDNLYQ
jgi:long-chain acyl-CoA synthetase